MAKNRNSGRKTGVSNLLALAAVTALVGIAGLSQAARASNMASDNAGNSVYLPTTSGPSGSNWISGTNGGSGFSAWSLAPSATGGCFINSATWGGITPFFDVYETSTSSSLGGTVTTSATRPFTGGALAVGQSVSFDWVLNQDATNGAVGYSLNDSSGNSLFKFYQMGNVSTAGYITDASGTHAGVGIAYNYQYLDAVTFTLTSATAYNLKVVNTNGTVTYSGAISDGTGGIESLSFFANESGPNSDVQFTNLAIVPVPSTLAVLACGLGLAAVAMRRRRLVKG